MISLALVVLAAISNAVMDKLQFHFTKSVFADMNPLFWNPKYSWQNKWELSDDGTYTTEKFWGSSRWFVFLTDGWHLFQMIMLTLITLAIIFYNPMHSWWLDFIIYRVAWGLSFELFFAKVLSR